MTAPTHVVFGAAAALTLVHFTKAPPNAVCWLAIIFGSLAPDLDSKRSTISRPGYFFERLLPKIVVDLINVFGRLFAWLIQCVFGHRGVLHWPITGVAMLLAAVTLQIGWLAWFAWGYLSHILADFCTKGGIPIFAPLSTRMISWSPIRTGSFLEVTVCTLLCLFVVLLGYQYLPDATRSSIQQYIIYISDTS